MHCDYCHEPILPDERAPVSPGAFHRECLFRLVGGSIAHQAHLCSCYGRGPDDSEDGLSLRDGARAAVSYFKAHQPH